MAAPQNPNPSSAPLCCSKKAYQSMTKVVADIDAPEALFNAAMAIAQHAMPRISKADVEDSLDELADQINARVRGTQWQARIAHLHDILFDQEGFVGNTLNYHDPANSYLPKVLETQRGLPISLSLVYKLVAEKVGLCVRGIGLPGHFIVGVESPDGLMLIDPFFGGTLITPSEAQDRIRDTYGSDVQWSDELLEPIPNRHWITRMIQNLLHSHSQAGRMSDVAAMIELQMLLWPDQNHLQRDLGLVLARMGLVQPASRFLGLYLDSCPDDPHKSDLEQLLQALAA
jgi:regulator of sirC expression with transglutaminase-like and TPR domain